MIVLSRFIEFYWHKDVLTLNAHSSPLIAKELNQYYSLAFSFTLKTLEVI
ncbi:hypothetical protein RC62_3207 [Flavobacterium aquidurense]|uniref:Uncharacterized protein n=1 Tax=Flavobacterium aquidurense TaxID=362413 RepID=A0A0Q0W9I8_9FLAO|nr:hypothetical protein RC62_3207 [Flavobacterium aquidurense]